ncbi:MAG TPA: beta-L-arabinofuranosidase domain-containing protein [Fimbriimonadaceae bacterium]|nr:beta-L-arabinofuranosidase domain-containing protein [Fimbriimonadaceae bacterium]
MGVMMGMLLAATIASKNSPVPERRLVMPLDYQGVRITGGLLRNQMDDAKEFYLRIPNDDLLLGFRRRAGKPAPGEELGGWYSDDVFHIFGQILSGLSRLYAATGDPACKAKAEALYEGWRDCIAPDGYFYYSKSPNAPHYIYDKMVGGLVDMAIYLGDQSALTSLAKITGWAETNLDRTRPYGADGNEWYTLSENLYRAYLLTGDTRYRDFAKVWEYTPYWKLYAENKSIFSVASWMHKPTGQPLPDLGPNPPDTNIGYHAYSHVNTLGGAALAYRVTGDRWYLDAIRNAYDFLQKDECFATGGYGPDEGLLEKGELERRLDSTSATFETQCGSWAIFKLCKNLIAITGDAKYGDWVEKAAYNGIGATIPENPNGDVFYYSSYNPFGARKVNHWDAWSCCAGTRTQAVADVDDLIYFKSPDGIDVNLFVPSTGQFEIGGTAIEIEQQTRFPEAPNTEITVRALKSKTRNPSSTAFALRFRAPSWLSGPARATVNGEPVDLKADDKHWLVLRRKWTDGDRVELTLPMALHAVPFDPVKPYPTAIADGPVVLAFRTPATSPVKDIDLDRLSTDLIPSPGEPLCFHVKDHPEILARPFYAYKEGEEYYMYLEPGAAGRFPYTRMKKSGEWRDSGRFWFSNQVGAWCEGEVEGTGFRLIGWAYDDGGHAEVKVDGKAVGTIDQYGAGRDLPFDWKIEGLGPGRHTVRITVLADKDQASKDHYINVGGFQSISG